MRTRHSIEELVCITNSVGSSNDIVIPIRALVKIKLLFLFFIIIKTTIALNHIMLQDIFMKKISSMKELIFVLGGIEKTKKLLSVNRSTIWRWQTNRSQMHMSHYKSVMKKAGITFQELEAINIKAE